MKEDKGTENFFTTNTFIARKQNPVGEIISILIYGGFMYWAITDSSTRKRHMGMIADFFAPILLAVSTAFTMFEIQSLPETDDRNPFVYDAASLDG